MRIKVFKYQEQTRNEDFACPLKSEEDLILVRRILLIVLRKMLRPDDVRNEQHEKKNESDIRETKMHPLLPLRIILKHLISQNVLRVFINAGSAIDTFRAGAGFIICDQLLNVKAHRTDLVAFPA